MINEYKLDNPAWNSLNEEHEGFSLQYKSIKFYNPEYCPFGGCTDIETAIDGISQYSRLTNSFFTIGEHPILNSDVLLINHLICNQMILNRSIDITLVEDIIPLKTTKQKQQLIDLVNLVQPGYFKEKTVSLGRYAGIYKNNKLVAVCGERMKMYEFTEISAIVTHPNYTGNGYAKQLIKYITENIFVENKIPYLHVVDSNQHAIGIYKKLGFSTRRKINFWNLKSR